MAKLKDQLDLEHYAAMCGIYSAGKTVRQVRAEFEAQRSRTACDQHDAKFDEVLRQLEQMRDDSDGFYTSQKTRG